MKVVDLTVTLSSDMPVFPGAPAISIEEQCSVKEKGFRVTDIKVDSHSGTHIDGPAHMLEGAEMLGDLPIDQFIGPAFMMDVSAYAGSKVPLEEFKKYEEEIKNTEFIILNSGWHKKYATEAYNHDFPNPTKEAADYIVGFAQLKGIGIDMPTLDHHGLEPLTVHKTMMANKKIIIENLSNLDGLPSKFLLCCLPLKFKDAEGAPCRAIAVVDPAWKI
jgi:arylformamidase